MVDGARTYRNPVCAGTFFTTDPGRRKACIAHWCDFEFPCDLSGVRNIDLVVMILFQKYETNGYCVTASTHPVSARERNLGLVERQHNLVNQISRVLLEGI